MMQTERRERAREAVGGGWGRRPAARWVQEATVEAEGGWRCSSHPGTVSARVPMALRRTARFPPPGACRVSAAH